jgi:sugar/nucleoside kinase (ribokinase family)
MLTEALVETILRRLPALHFGVVGDLFLDRYFDLDAALTEPSIETGLDAYQAVRVRSYPGAAGTVINNLVALGAGKISPVAVIGDDGEGYELLQALRQSPSIDVASVFSEPERRTPTYMKPMLGEPGRPARELHRIDIKNRVPLSAQNAERIVDALHRLGPACDALLVLDQVSERDCGVITDRVRAGLQELGTALPGKLILADSREHIGLFRAVALKPNRAECLRAAGMTSEEEAARALARQAGRPVFCTMGARGILVAEGEAVHTVPGYPVAGPIDPVGAGDSTSAGIACALAAGASLVEAAAFGNLIASITIQQVGTTGTAAPDQVQRRWQEVASGESQS